MPEVVEVLPGPEATDHRRMAKVVVRYPFNVKEVRSRFPSFHSEADVVFANRCRIDYRLTYATFPAGEQSVYLSRIQTHETAPPVKPRLGYLDIEVDDSGDFAMPDNAFAAVTAVSYYDTYKNQYGAIYNGSALDEAQVLSHLSEHPLGGAVKFFPVHTEHDLLGSLGALLRMIDPDIVQAWNGYGYDFGYLAARAKILWASDPNNADLRLVYESFDEHVRRSHGRYALLDPMKVYQKQELAQRDHSLQAVSMEFLGFGKIQREGTVAELMRKDPAQWIAYNLQDTHLMRLIDAKLNLTPYFLGIAAEAGVEPEDCVYNSRVVDGTLFAQARRTPDREPSICLPSKDFAPHALRRGRAAEVFTPVAGMHEWLIGLDLSQEYPSVMVTLNIGPETRIRGTIPEDGTCYILPSGNAYVKWPHGLVANALIRFRKIRDETKAVAARFAVGTPERDRAEQVSTATKFVVNSYAGVYDDPHWRLADVSIFEDITGISRLQLQWNRDHLQDPKWLGRILGPEYLGYVVMGDTDSCYVRMTRYGEPVTDYDEIVVIAQKLKDGLNASYPEFMAQFGVDGQNYTEVGLEGIFERLRILPLAGSTEGAKKRYFGIYANVKGKDVRDLSFDRRKKISGLEIKRFNAAPITKEAQLKAVELQCYGRAKEIVTYRDALREDVFAGKRDDDLFIPCKMGEAYAAGRTPPVHVRAMNNAVGHLGIRVRAGDAMRWAYVSTLRVKGVGIRDVDALAIPKLATLVDMREQGIEIVVDRVKMFKKDVDEPLSLVYPEIGGVQASLEERW
jgi:DNA polymerase elongation subunit (family B)